MSMTIDVEMNSGIRRDMQAVFKHSGDGIVNLMFARGTLTLLGYTNSSFCICKEYIPCEIPYTFRVESGILASMIGCPKVRFNIDIKNVNIVGLAEDERMIREVQVRLNTDTTVNYQAEYYKDLIDKLRSGYTCQSLSSLKHFDKISRCNAKSERGVIITKKQFYTCGDGFKYYARTDMGFNSFLLSDDLRNLIDFVGNDETIIYENSGYIVAKNNNDCYFGIRVAVPPEDIRDLDIVLKQKSECSFKIPMSELKICLRPVKANATNDGEIVFMPKRGLVVVGLPTAVYKLPFEYKDLTGENTEDVKLNFKLFNKLLQTIDVREDSTITVYRRYISIISSDESILLIGRE